MSMLEDPRLTGTRRGNEAGIPAYIERTPRGTRPLIDRAASLLADIRVCDWQDGRRRLDSLLRHRPWLAHRMCEPAESPNTA